MSRRRCRHGAQGSGVATIGSQSSEKETSSTPQKTAQLLELSRVEGELVANDCSIGDSTSSWFEVQYQNKTDMLNDPLKSK